MATNATKCEYPPLNNVIVIVNFLERLQFQFFWHKPILLKHTDNKKLPHSSYLPMFLQVCKEGNEPEPVAVDCGRCGQLLLSCRLPGAGCSFPSTSKGTTPKLQQRALTDIFMLHPVHVKRQRLYLVQNDLAHIPLSDWSFQLICFFSL